MSHIVLYIYSKNHLDANIPFERFYAVPLKHFLHETKRLENGNNQSPKKKKINHFYKMDILKALKHQITLKKYKANKLNLFADITYKNDGHGKMSVLKTVGITSCESLEEFRNHFISTANQRHKIHQHLLQIK